MLASDLLVAKISKGKIEPVYAHLDQDTLEIARSIIGVSQEHLFSGAFGENIR
jgi:predicted nuclease of restriction endonuclease-like RecB superfamily